MQRHRQLLNHPTGGSTSALDVKFPEAFNPQRIASMSQPVYSYDENGQMLMSYPGFAQALGEMNAEVQRTTQAVAGKLMATGDSYYMARAHALTTMAGLQNDINQMDMLVYATPMTAEQRMIWLQGSEDAGVSDVFESGTEEKATAMDKNDNPWNKAAGTTGITKTQQDNKERTVGKKEEKEGQYTQQFKSGKVSSDDYEVEKRNVTLYLRDGDKAKPFLHNKELCRKGATYYIKVNNQYYRVGYFNWGRFSRSIMYGTQSVYFNM